MKKKNRQEVDLTPKFSARAFFETPRRRAVLCVAALCVLWLIQFYGVLFGGMNLWEDVIQADYPNRYFTRSAFFQFEFPHWNPFTFGGMPFFATGVGVFYPFNIILSLLPVSDAVFWYLIQTVIVFHSLIAGIAMFVYLRFKGRSDTAALFGAVAFMFSGYIITRVIHSTIICIVAWLPLILLFLERSIQKNNPRYAVIGGLILGAVMQAGHAQVMFYTVVFLLTFSVYCIFQSKNLLTKRIIVALCFFVVAAGLCLVQYLPIFEASGHTSRIEYTLNDASEGSLQLVQLLTALMPKVFGANTGYGETPGFWLESAFGGGYHNYWETSFYFGISTLILSLLMFRKIKTDRSLIFKLAWILGSLVIALGGNFFAYKLLFSLGIPGFNSFRHTPRILFIWALIFPVMAAAVLDSLEDLRTKKMKIISLSLCAMAIILGILTINKNLPIIFGRLKDVFGEGDEQVLQYVTNQGYILFLNAMLFGYVLLLFFINKINADTAKKLIVGCLAMDMLIFAAGHHIRNDDGADAVFAEGSSFVEKIKEMREDDFFRTNTRQFNLNPGKRISGHTSIIILERNQGYVSGIETIEGYSPFRLKYESLPLNSEKFNVLLDLMNVRYFINPYFNMDDAEDEDFALENETYLPRAKLFYNAKFVMGGDHAILNYMNSPKYDHHKDVVVDDSSFIKFNGDNGNGNVEITKYKFNRIELDVDTDSDAILWMSEIWYPAWKATVNGKKTKVYRANHSFRAITVPAGKSKVVFKFDSKYFNVGALISLLTLVGALAYLFFRKRVSI